MAVIRLDLADIILLLIPGNGESYGGSRLNITNGVSKVAVGDWTLCY